MRITTTCIVAAMVPLASVLCAQDSPAEAGARRCVSQFVSALERSDASGLRDVLPTRGKVLLQLNRLGPQSGHFSGSQVEALLADFLTRGSLESFELLRLEHNRAGYALARGKARLVDRNGHPCSVELRLAVEPEGPNWVVREIRESPG